MLFAKDFLVSAVNDYNPDTEVVEERLTGTSRWSIHYSVVFKFMDKFYLANFRRGATEQQDEQPYEYDKAEIEVPEVRQVEVLVKKYEVIK
jgi:hypothetical protein